MENFLWDIPTKMFFGRGVCSKIKNVLPRFGSKILLLRGGNSSIKNGVRDKVVAEIIAAGMEYTEFEGIKSNPRIDEIRDAVSIARSFKPDVIIAIGGGSVIDSAKAISASALYDNDPWDLFDGKLIPKKVVPLIAVLTLAATGTEMNHFCVVQNKEAGQKTDFASNLIAPVYSFLDPTFTISVPRNYTAFGIADIAAHCMEAYFGEGDASLSDKFAVSIIKELIEYGPKLLHELDNYDLRAKIMYAATCALNEMTLYGRVSGDWGVHAVGHTFSLVYDIPHGASLSAVYPAWLKLMQNRIPNRIAKLGKDVFGVENVEQTIAATERMFTSFLSPINIKDLKIVNFSKEKIINALIKSNATGSFCKLDINDYNQLIDLMNNEK